MVFSKLFLSWLRFLTRDTFLIIISSKFSSLLLNPDLMDFLSHASFDSSYCGHSLEYLNSNGGYQHGFRRTWCHSWIWFNRRHSPRINIQVYISVRPTAHIPTKLSEKSIFLMNSLFRIVDNFKVIETMFEPKIGSTFILLWSFLAAVCQSGKQQEKVINDESSL